MLLSSLRLNRPVLLVPAAFVKRMAWGTCLSATATVAISMARKNADAIYSLCHLV